MSFSNLTGERGLRASLPSALTGVLALVLLLVACGGPDGSDAPRGSTAAAASAAVAADADTDAGADAGADGDSPAAEPGSTAASAAGDLAHLGGADLEVASYPVEAALAAEGGDAIASMLRSLGVDPADVDLTLAVAPGGDPTISDWRLPGASADAIQEAWAASGPGTWSSTTLDGVPALAGSGLDGSSAWAVATNGRFVYIRTDDHAVAAEAAAIIGPAGE